MNETKDDSGLTAPKARKPYEPPRLVMYGHVKDIVQGAGGNGLDVGGGHSKACWIAEALYGADDARTLWLRAWLTVVYDERRPGCTFVVLYRKFGRQVAQLVANGLLPRRLFRTLFDALLTKALDDVPRFSVGTRR